MPQTQTKNGDSAADQTTERIRDLNERFIVAGRKAGENYLDAYERSVKTMTDFTEKAAQASNVEWVQNIATAQADLARDMAKAYADTARSLIK